MHRISYYKRNHLIILVLIIFCHGNNDREYFARINEEYLTVDEFTKRLKFFTRLTGIADNLQTRETLLDHMINERLLIQDFKQKGLENSPEFRRKVESIRTQFYLDAFRKKAFFDTITVSDQEIHRKFAYYNQKVSARHLYARTEDEANELYQKLQQGATFEELARITFQEPTLASNGGYLGYFGKDEMDPEFEKVAFSLKVGEISPPVRTQYGYSIIKVEDRFIKPFTSESEFVAVKPKIEKIVRGEKSIAAAQDYGNKLARDLELQFNDQMVQFIFSQIQTENDSTDFQFRSEKLLTSDLLNQIKDETLVSFNKGEWSVAKFLDRSRMTSKRQQIRVNNTDYLKQFIAGLIVREQLVEQALEMGINNDSQVQYEIDHATEGYIVAQMTKMITDTATVPFEAAKEIYEKDSESYVFPAEANVGEILVANRKLADEILNKIEKGESFVKLAQKFSQREWARHRGGELGFAPRSKYGALSDTIFSLQPGQIIGPIEIEEFFSIIQMIDIKPEHQKRFEEARPQIETEQLWKWRKIRLHNYIAQLKDQASIEINRDKLRWFFVK